MPALTIDVPPEQHDDLLRVLLGLYAQKAEAVQSAAEDYLANEASLPALANQRAELASLDALLDQLGWRLNEAPEPARVTGERHLLAALSFGALHTAVEDLGESVSAPAPGPREVEAIGRVLRRVSALFALLQTIQRPASSPA
jgi:hypothetical protein